MGRIAGILLILMLTFSVLNAKTITFKVMAKNIEYSLYKKNRLLWQFKAKIFKEENDNIYEATGIIIINLQKNLKIIADKGIYNKKSGEFLLLGRVHLFTKKFGEVFTAKLLYFPKKGLIITDKEVLVKKKGLIARGKGLIYKLDTGDFKIKEKTKIKFNM